MQKDTLALGVAAPLRDDRGMVDGSSSTEYAYANYFSSTIPKVDPPLECFQQTLAKVKPVGRRAVLDLTSLSHATR